MSSNYELAPCGETTESSTSAPSFLVFYLWCVLDTPQHISLVLDPVQHITWRRVGTWVLLKLFLNRFKPSQEAIWSLPSQLWGQWLLAAGSCLYSICEQGCALLFSKQESDTDLPHLLWNRRIASVLLANSLEKKKRSPYWVLLR